MPETRCTCGAGHSTFGACMRAKGVRTGWSQSAKGLDLTAEKSKDRELHEYREARRQGIQPEGTKLAQTRMAVEMSDRGGYAYDASA